MNDKPKPFCWTVKMNRELKKKPPTAFTMPRLKQALELIAPSIRFFFFFFFFIHFHIDWSNRKRVILLLFSRYWWYHSECARKQVQPHMDFLKPVKLRQTYGAPIGGIGAGTIGRTYTGDFARYQLVPGIYEHELVADNMFTVSIRRASTRTPTYQQALCTRRPSAAGFASWNTRLPAECGTYHALYPEAWTVYELPGQHVTLTCHQLSPVLPHNYTDSSLPVALFHWTVANEHAHEDIELSLMFTWQAGSTSDRFELANVASRAVRDHCAHAITATGVMLKQTLKAMPLEYCIAAKQSVIT